MENSDDYKTLDLCSTIGFNGHVYDGLQINPDREHMIYPLGCQIVIRNLNTGKQEFLRGHENNITCMTMSKDGKYLASGQVTYMGFRADVILWDYEKRKMLHRLTLHKVKVQALAFSPNSKYLASLGGEDDCSVVVWNVNNGQSVCGADSALKSAGNVLLAKFSNTSDDVFITAGDRTLRVWYIDAPNRKIKPEECNYGKIKRVIKSVEVDLDDKFFYCGTTTGDIVRVNMKTKLLNNIGPVKATSKYSLGITAMKLLKTTDLLIGTGAGRVAVVRNTSDKYSVIKPLDAMVKGEVTSISLRGEGHQFFVGTFPSASSQLFATCSGDDIRIWHTVTSRELLRISVPNMTCNAIEFTQDGQSILSAWDDGKIRAFLPETGKPYYTINNAHHAGVFAVTSTSDGKRIVSGGGEGQVRVWDLTYQPLTQTFAAAMKEHTSKVTCLKLTADNRECVSASADGTCIIWDLERFTRNQMVLCNTLFQCVCYHPELPQIVTSGTDRKIAYWETLDGSQIRELEGSKSGSINGIDLTGSGKVMVTGGDDRIIKLWNYKDGTVSHVGIGHSGNVLRVRVCPNLQYIVSVSQDGAVLIWKFPEEAENNA